MNTQTTIPGMLDHEQEETALKLLKSAKYKQAGKLFKELLKDSEKQEWQEKLAYCYVQRALDFSKKGMYKEALVLWENHVQYAQPPYAAYQHSIIWQMLAEKQDDFHASLRGLSAQQLDKQYPELAAVLGLLILTKQPELAQYIAQDSVFEAHLAIAQTALQAFQNKNDEQLQCSLKQLPYRSAFRDLRSLLKAILAMSDSLEQAQSLLGKISTNSVYYQAARLLSVFTQEGAALEPLDYQQRRLIVELKCFNKTQMEFIEHYCRLQDKLSDKVQFNLVIQYRSLLGREFTQKFCQQLLPRYPAGKKDFNKHFPEVSEFEEHRVNALICEQDNNLYDAGYYWGQCINNLKEEKADNNLKIALILRHMAKAEPNDEDRMEMLIDSLDFDADDRNTYLQIIKSYSQQTTTANAYKKWLNKTLERFPLDIEVLTLAVKLATANQTYKKASQYASKILKVDPLNSFARQALFTAHKAQARKLMREKKYALVEKEIKQAEKLKLGKSYQQQIQLMQALLCFADQDKQLGQKTITAALDSLATEPVSIHFYAATEALLNGLPVATLLRDLPTAKECLLSEQELITLTELLQQFASETDDKECLQKALDKIKAPLKKSITDQLYAEPVILNLCKALDSVGHFELLRHCAKTAQLKWKQPVWVYYRIYADHNGETDNYSYLEVNRLQNAHEQASKDKDYVTAMLVDGLLEGHFASHPQPDLSFFDELLGLGEQEDEQGDPLEELFAHLPDGVLIELNKTAEGLVQKLTPEKLTKSLMKQIGNDETLLYAVMQNPDIFSALMLIKAADKLQIDIDVNVHDVIDIFGITDKPTFPF